MTQWVKTIFGGVTNKDHRSRKRTSWMTQAGTNQTSIRIQFYESFIY